MNKDFDAWNGMKKKLDARHVTFHAKERQVWWCSLGINVGSEQNGKNENFERPVLIRQFINKDMLVILPFTSRPRSDRHHVTVETPEGQNVSVILSQIRVISPKRLLRQVGWISEDEFCKIQKRFREYFCPEMSKPLP